MITVNTERCKGCGLCTDICPRKLIEMGKERNSKGYYTAECTDKEKCVSCAVCAVICPDCAIKVERSVSLI